jgi:hypothetical protein
MLDGKVWNHAAFVSSVLEQTNPVLSLFPVKRLRNGAGTKPYYQNSFLLFA